MTTVVYLDIDRTLSPINDTQGWPDYGFVVGGPVGGDVILSPMMLARLAAVPAELCIVSDWSEETAALFLQRLGEHATYLTGFSVEFGLRRKLAVIDQHLRARPDIDRIVWADDHLNRNDADGVAWMVSADEIAAEHGVRSLFLAPVDGLTPDEVRELEDFCR